MQCKDSKASGASEPSRRQIVKAGGALALMTAMPSGAAFAQAAVTPKKGGRLRIGMAGGQTTNTLDTTAGSFGSPAERTINYTLYNTLVEIAPDGRAIPELAESWEVEPGAKRWVFNLRRGVTFHDGKELTADDAVFSIMRHIAPGSTSGSRGLLRDVTKVTKLDKYQFQIDLAQGDAQLHFLLSSLSLSVIPDGQTQMNGIGTGPYVLKSYSPGVSFFATKHAGYWKADRAHVDEVEITIVNDDNARLGAFQTGEVDVINRLDPRAAALLRRIPELNVVRTDGYGFYTVNMMTDIPPFNNKDLRLAFKYAVNRQELLNRILNGFGSLGNDHPISAKSADYVEGLAQREQDLEKARFYFKKSGYSGPIPLHTSTAAFSGAIDFAVLLQEQARQAGMDIRVVREPPDGYWSNIWKKAPFMISYWSGRPNANAMYMTGWYSQADSNETRWASERFDELFVKVRVETDPGKQAEMYGEMQRIVHEEGGNMIPVFNSFLDGMRSNIRGDLSGPTGDLAGSRIAERVWIG